jgi:hypothetical protein
MTNVTVQLTPETEHRLRQRASRRGETLETYLGRLAEREAAGGAGAPDMLDQGVEWLTSRGAAEVQAARERIFGAAPAPRELPAGKSVVDVVEGKWPGDENDAEVRDALDRIS